MRNWKKVSKQKFDEALKGKELKSNVLVFLTPTVKFYWDKQADAQGVDGYDSAVAKVEENFSMPSKSKYYLKVS